MEELLKSFEDLQLESKNDPDKLSSLIDTYLIPTATEKKKNAEISTPYTLRQEMLDKVPEDFWKTPQKVLEPCCGKGGFVIDVYRRFKQAGLDDRTIIEECIYFADINPLNIYITELVLHPEKKYKVNKYIGDTLKMEFDVKFDLVVGNPPYNNELWAKFVTKAIDYLNKDGYLLFIHPANWRKPEHKIGKMMLSHNIIHLCIYDIKRAMKIFNCNVRVDWYLLKCSSDNNFITNVIDEAGVSLHIELNNLPFIPNKNIELILKIINFKDIPKLNIVRSHKFMTNNKSFKSDKDNVNIYQILTNLNAKGRRIKYFSNPHPDHYNLKVIMSYALHLYPFYDNGMMSPTEHTLYQLVKNEDDGNNLVAYLNSKLLKLILSSCKWIGYQTDHKVFKYLPDISDIKLINDSEIYKYFNLSQEEINLIEE